MLSGKTGHKLAELGSRAWEKTSFNRTERTEDNIGLITVLVGTEYQSCSTSPFWPGQAVKIGVGPWL